MQGGDDNRLYALHAEGAERIRLEPVPEPFYSLYERVRPGIYEAARTYESGRVFAFELHQSRLEAGMLATGYRAAITELELRRALQQAMDDYPTSPIKMRWDLSPEPFTALGTDARMIATLVPNKPQPDWVYEQGVNLSLNTDLQRTIPTTKGAAFALERNQIEFGTRDHFEPVMVDDSGHLLEGVMSNFGAILEGRLYTRSRKVLPGITIRTLLQLAEQIGLEVVNEPIHRDDLGRIEEAFLCSAVRGLVSARSIDGVTIGSGKPGPWVQRLASAYALHAESNAKRLWPV